MLRLVIGSALILASFSAPAFAEVRDGIDVRSVWKEVKATAGKQFLAHLARDAYTASGSVLLFGTDGARQSTRSLPLRWGFPSRAGLEDPAADDFYTATLYRLSANELKVVLKGKRPGYDQELRYKLVENDTQLVDQAFTRTKAFYARYDKLLENETPANVATVRGIVGLVERAYGFSLPEDIDGVVLPFPYTVYGLQIEFTSAASAANTTFASTVIKPNASDAISKKINTEGKWTKAADLPDAESAYEQHREADQMPTYFVYGTKVDEGLEPGILQNGIKKFARYQIVSYTPWECEDHYFFEMRMWWVLSDGSIVNYAPTLECD